MAHSSSVYVASTRLYDEFFGSSLVEVYATADDGSLVAVSKQIVPNGNDAAIAAADGEVRIAHTGDGWIWASDDTTVLLWHAASRWKHDVGRRYRCYGRHRLRLRVDVDGVRIFGRCRDVALSRSNLVAVQIRRSGIVPRFALVLTANHRDRECDFAICRVVDSAAVVLALDVAPSPWLEPGEHQEWLKQLGRELARCLGLPYIESACA